MYFTAGIKSSPQILLLLYPKLLSSHRGFLTYAMPHLIKLLHYDKTKKTAHDSQIVGAKENLNLSHGEPSQRQASETNSPMKEYKVP